MAWPKGLKELFDLMNYLTKRTGQCFPLDLYGNGPHLQDIMNSAKALKLAVSFPVAIGDLANCLSNCS